jgi:hypothetical protein
MPVTHVAFPFSQKMMVISSNATSFCLVYQFLPYVMNCNRQGAKNHRHRNLLPHPEYGENDPADFLFLRVRQDVREDGDDPKLVHLLRDARVEREDPETEGELVLDLEVDPAREDADQSVEAVEVDKGQAVVVHAKHHLEATNHGLNVLVVLKIEQITDDGPFSTIRRFCLSVIWVYKSVSNNYASSLLAS